MNSVTYSNVLTQLACAKSKTCIRYSFRYSPNSSNKLLGWPIASLSEYHAVVSRCGPRRYLLEIPPPPEITLPHTRRGSGLRVSISFHFCRAMLCISAAYAVTRCLSVRTSVTFVSCVKTNKDIFEIFHHRIAKPF